VGIEDALLMHRTLGKKIVMEDEMVREDVATPGADVKRMTPRGSVRR